MGADVPTRGLLEQAQDVRRRRVTPGELLDAMRARRREVDDELNSVCAVDPSSVDEQLARVGRGALYGVPVGVKDAIALPWRAPHDGTPVASPSVRAGAGGAVARLQAAGALTAVATTMHQLGIGTTGHVSATGPTRNPADLTRVAGGSSGGSAAAVAAGILGGAIGTDAGGSVRIPAAYCGVVGLKPTWGAVPTDGCTGAYSSVGVIGPLAARAADCRALAEALLGRTLPSHLPEPLRIDLLGPLWDDVDPEVDELCRGALALLAGDGVHVGRAMLDDAEHVAAATMVVTGTERIPQVTERWVREVFGTLDPSVRGIIKARIGLSAGDVQRVARYRTLLRERVAELFGRSPLLACPTVPAPAPPVDRPRVDLPSGRISADAANLQLVGLANLTGIPAISVPVGVTRAGLPVGLMLHAPWGREDLLLAVAERLEDLGARSRPVTVTTTTIGSRP